MLTDRVAATEQSLEQMKGLLQHILQSLNQLTGQDMVLDSPDAARSSMDIRESFKRGLFQDNGMLDG